MDQFIDDNGCQVAFSEDDMSLSAGASHVLVMCIYEKKWVLTKHGTRGLEFPGGKAEANESLEEAAQREVYEETGGVVSSLVYLGSYKVECPGHFFSKSVYFANLARIDEKHDYYETYGPELFDSLPENMKYDDRFSYIMKDRVVKICLDIVHRKGLK